MVTEMKRSGTVLMCMVLCAVLLPPVQSVTFFITASSDRSLYGANETVVITGVLYQDGVPLAGSSVDAQLYNSDGGIEKVNTILTDVDGGFTWSVTISDSPTVGLWTAYLSKSAYTKTLQFTVSDAPPEVTNLHLSGTVVGYGNSIDITADASRNSVWHVKVYATTESAWLSSPTASLVRDLSDELGVGTTPTHLVVSFDGKNESAQNLPYQTYLVVVYAVSGGAKSNEMLAEVDVSLYPCVIKNIYFTNMNQQPLTTVSPSTYFYINVVVENRGSATVEGLVVLAYGRNGYTFEDIGAYYGNIHAGEQTISLLFKTPASMMGIWEANTNVWSNWQYNNPTFEKYAETVTKNLN